MFDIDEAKSWFHLYSSTQNMGLQKRRHGVAHLRVVVEHGLPLVELHKSAPQVGEGVPRPRMRRGVFGFVHCSKNTDISGLG